MKYNIALLALLIATTTWADADKVQKQLQRFEANSGKAHLTVANELMKTFQEEEITDEIIHFEANTPPDSLCAQVWYWAAEYFYAEQQYQQAVTYGCRSLPLCKGTDTEADCLSIISLAYFRMSDYDQAAHYAKQCYKLDEQSGDPDVMSSSLNTLAGIYIGANRPKEAE